MHAYHLSSLPFSFLFPSRAHSYSGDHHAFASFHQGDSFAEKLAGSFLNGSIVLATIFSLTLLFVLFLYLRLFGVIRAFLLSILGVFFVGAYAYFGIQLCVFYEVRVDPLSFAFVVGNLGAVGVFTLDYLRDSRALLQKATLMLLSLAMAWPLFEFPEWSVWCTLVCLAVYDILAGTHART